jgi:hypothetical protein
MKHIILFSIVLFAVSCTEILVMVPEFEPPTSERVVLIEELTGASCPACPAGAEELASIKTLYGERVVIIGIHGDFQSWPTADSKYDFRNDDALELENYLKPWQGKPAASINRVQFPGQEYFAVDQDFWGNFIDQELNKEHLANLEIEVEYDSETRNVSIKAGIIPLKDLDGEFRFSLALLENHIIDAQKNQTTIIEEYDFEHVLMDMITAPLGDPIGNSLEKNKIINLTYNYVLPEADNPDELLWIPEDCEIVGFVHYGETERKEVLQAAKADLIQ